MRTPRNIVPAGCESDDDEYDEFGNPRKQLILHSEPKKEDFRFTLLNACNTNNVPDIIRALNSGCVGINDLLENNWTALMNAASNGSIDAVKYLLQNGADPLVEYDWFNPIMCICKCGTVSNESNLLECLKLILSLNCIDINSKERSGCSALMFACSNGLLKIVKLLVDHGADIELKNNQNDETALFFAVRSNHADVVKFLLSRGADKNATDKKFDTVDRMAESKNMVDILNLLNVDHNNDKLQVYYSEEDTYWDVVMTEMKNGFNTDVQTFLENLSMEVYADKIKTNNVSFKQLLTGKKQNFVDMGILLSPHYKVMDLALKTFHQWNWSTNSLRINKKELSSENVAQNLAIVVKHLHILDASLIYLGTHSYRLNQKKGQEAMNILNSIKVTEEKIFKLLDKKTRVSKVDYFGPPKIEKNQKSKVSFVDKMLFSTAVFLALLRVV